jgi:hypothetical protein
MDIPILSPDPLIARADSRANDTVFYFGNSNVIFRSSSNNFVILLGPNWISGGLFLLLITAIQAYFLYLLKGEVHPAIRALMIFNALLALVLQLFLNLSDPGLIPIKLRHLSSSAVQDKNKYSCRICLAPQQLRAEHCPECEICVVGKRHHSPFIGKCVGDRIVTAFWIFWASVTLNVVGEVGCLAFVYGYRHWFLA